MSRSPRLYAAACASLVVLAAVPAAATFTRITTGDIVTTPANYWGGSWGDYDDDGWLDLFVGATFASKTNYLYHNDHDGAFTLIDQAAMPKSPSNQHGAAWADYDNDGHLDLIVTSGNPELTHTMLYHNNGDGTFSWTTANAIYNDDLFFVSPNVHAPKWGDYDNDGLIDLFLVGHDIRNRLFHNDGGGSFTRILNHVLVNSQSASEGGAWVDYDDDGDLDLFVTNTSSFRNALYRNDQNGVFSKVTTSGLTPRIEHSIGSCFGDYDNDGLPDLFLANFAAKNSLYHNSGDGTFSAVLDSAVVADSIPAGWLSGTCAWGDYDNDGFLDLVVPSANEAHPPVIDGHTSLYHNEGDGTFTKVTEGSVANDPTGAFASWVDYDNDGFLDLFLAQGELDPVPRTNLLYHNDGNANAWLNVKLVGTVSNRSAIGAKVRIHAFYRGASRWQVREISGGDSGDNQQSLNAEFGLADATSIDTLRIEWPSGVVQELHDVAPRHFLTLTELVPEPAALLQAMAALAALAALSHSCRRT